MYKNFEFHASKYLTNDQNIWHTWARKFFLQKWYKDSKTHELCEFVSLSFLFEKIFVTKFTFIIFEAFMMWFLSSF